jgi:hypothetical protein
MQDVNALTVPRLTQKRDYASRQKMHYVIADPFNTYLQRHDSNKPNPAIHVSTLSQANPIP